MIEKKILEQVAKEFNLPKQKIKTIYSDWLDYIKESIRDMDFSEYTGQLGFTIPHVGKIYVDKKKLPYINQKKNKNGRT
jgi:hypothetical protein